MTDRHPNRIEGLDAQLNRALASYTPAEAPAGLEHRLTALLAAAAVVPRRRQLFALRWAWIAAAGLAAAAVLLAVLLRTHASVPAVQIAAVRDHPAPRVMTASPAIRTAPGKRERGSSERSVGAVRQTPRYIKPQPTQQQLIAQLLATGPEAIRSLAQAAEQQEKPIEIQPLNSDELIIEPIRINPIDDNSAEPGGTF